MKKLFCLLLVYTSLTSVAQSQAPRVFLLDANSLVVAKQRLAAKEPATVAIVDSLRKKADALLAVKPRSVMDKIMLPVSGNKHDYMSQAPYFWYDSTKPNGRPYMRRDGEHNPEIKKITDRTYIGDLESASRTLAVVYWLTGEEKYAAKAAQLIRVWFLDSATRMNPHLDYGQAIPGINSGRGIGIIETRTLTGIADAAGLIEGSRSWSGAETKALKQWYKQYLHWMLTSKNGGDEHAAKNNHGTWYYVQVIDFALFVSDTAKARQLVAEGKQLLNNQLTAEGKWPLELERTNALGYSTFNTAAWFQVAMLAEKTGVDLWHYTTPQKAGIETALDWLRPYATGLKAWTYQQIGTYNQAEYYALLLQAAQHYRKAVYVKEADRLNITNKDLLTELLYR